MTQSDREFLLRYTLIVLTIPLAAHLIAGLRLAQTDSGGFVALLLLVSWSLLPYLAMALFAWVIRSRVVLVLAVVLIATTDLLALLGTLYPKSSTAGVALLVQPALGLLIALVALILGVWRHARTLVREDRAKNSATRTQGSPR